MKQVPYRLAEALENICKRKSLENITVSQIAQEAGVTRQVFYRYFEDKFELAAWIHYVHLYQSVKNALEERTDKIWQTTIRNQMYQLIENKEFYMNAFQSVSQKEFQRNIRKFFYNAYQCHMVQNMGRELTEDEAYILNIFVFGAMETIYNWISGGMVMSVERMVDILEAAMPEIVKKWVMKSDHTRYRESMKKMEEDIAAEGLLFGIS